MSTYEIRPRQDGPGVGLTDSMGKHADLWFRNANSALEYASFSARRDGGTIRVYGSSGTIQMEREIRKDSPVEGESLFELTRAGR